MATTTHDSIETDRERLIARLEDHDAVTYASRGSTSKAVIFATDIGGLDPELLDAVQRYDGYVAPMAGSCRGDWCILIRER